MWMRAVGAAVMAGWVLVLSPVAAAAPADLSVRDVGLSGTPSLPAGSKLQVKDRVTNTGKGRSTSATVRWWLSRDAKVGSGDIALTGARKLGGLAAGRSSTGKATVRIPKGARRGGYRLIACVVATQPRDADDCRALGRTIGIVPAGKPINGQAVVAAATKKSKLIPAASGGTVETRSADGKTRYLLTVPAKTRSCRTRRSASARSARSRVYRSPASRAGSSSSRAGCSSSGPQPSRSPRPAEARSLTAAARLRRQRDRHPCSVLRLAAGGRRRFRPAPDRTFQRRSGREG